MEKTNIAALLNEIRPEFDFTESQDFFADGMLDSFDLITLVAALEEKYNIQIKGTDIIPENFLNLDALNNLLCGYIEK